MNSTLNLWGCKNLGDKMTSYFLGKQISLTWKQDFLEYMLLPNFRHPGNFLAKPGSKQCEPHPGSDRAGNELEIKCTHGSVGTNWNLLMGFTRTGSSPKPVMGLLVFLPKVVKFFFKKLPLFVMVQQGLNPSPLTPRTLLHLIFTSIHHKLINSVVNTELFVVLMN